LTIYRVSYTIPSLTLLRLVMPRDVALELGKEEGRKIVLDEVKSRNRRQLGNFSVAGAKVSKRLGDNYRGIVREIMCFEDTFGLVV